MKHSGCFDVVKKTKILATKILGSSFTCNFDGIHCVCVRDDTHDAEEKTICNVYIRQVMYNNPATIVFWSDGTKTISKCSSRDEYSPEMGLALCITKKLSGNSLRDVFDEWIPDDATFDKGTHYTRTLKDLRADEKANK